VLRSWEGRTLPELLRANHLDDVPERPFVHDGWSGAELTALLPEGRPGYVLKRDSLARDWIARATRDEMLREAFLAAGDTQLPSPLWAPYLGAAADGAGAAILMPDLTGILLDWERVVGPDALERVLDGVARLHALPWSEIRGTGGRVAWPWCPLRERLLLLARPSAEVYRADGLAVGDRFLAGWDAFDRTASAPARTLIGALAANPGPLLSALARLPATGLHGDLKLANVGLSDDGRVALIDWGMMLLAPVAVELGWLLVSNVATIPEPPDDVLTRYLRAAEIAAQATLQLRGRASWPEPDPAHPAAETIDGGDGPSLPPRGLAPTIGDWNAQVDLIWIVGLLLRGWRKGLDAEAGVVLPTGVSAADDLAWWCERAVAAAGRRLG
jgi:hypothetical protein